MNVKQKPLVWLHGEIKSPPLSKAARIEAGFLLRQLQNGIKLSLPQSRPLASIGKRCHELRLNDNDKTWRIIYRIDSDAIILLEVFQKQTNKTPKQIIENSKRRLNQYDNTIS